MIDPTLLASFARLARENGSRLALVDGDATLTYAELDQRTNQLARVLRSRGVGSGVLAGIALRRSADLVTALFAVVKAGGAYVPLDPDYPAARLAQMLESAQPRVIVTNEEFASRLPVSQGTSLLCLDTQDGLLSAESSGELAPMAGPDDPLYVIFTSGSTGKPKGAIVQRRGFANLIEWFTGEFAINSADRFLLLSSPSFDLTQKNFFAPLCAGGTLVCYPPGPFDLTLIANMIESQGITVLNCTPSAFYPLVETINDRAMKRLASLRLVVLGGEPISIPRVRNWLEHPACRAEIANTYGPTECTDICGFHRLHRHNLDAFSFVPLGGTIPNVQLVVADETLHPCAAGEPGELLIGGAGVGPGYLGEPARTAASFVPNPLPHLLEGPVVYRTGDRVRLLPEDVLEFLGRLDHQIKLRGFRIELPEIEAALSAHPAVREAAVVLHQSNGEPELTAFYIPADSMDSKELRSHLAARLPDYMVPVKFIALDTFPLTPNGKVDRLRLAASDHATTKKPAPGTGMESAIHGLWTDALGQTEIGLDDNFFDLGGNSIQLAIIHARLNELIGRPIPITDLFAHSTIRALGRHLSGDTTTTAPDAIQQRALKQRQALAARRPLRT